MLQGKSDKVFMGDCLLFTRDRIKKVTFIGRKTW